ncbi:proteophosphoglycan precursor [Azospirillum sp. TSO35-2]|nr:proteophosphoglycan precursor [Azospirillum sp. TSO35-2]
MPTEETYDIRIARDGTWFHNGDPIRRIELSKLFSTVLTRDDAGEYWLVTPAERGRIVVEDAPFVAVEMTVSGSGTDQVVAFRTNLDHWVEAGPDHPIRVVLNAETGEPAPYIDVRGRLEARILRPVFYDMVERSETRRTETGESEVGLWSNKVFFALGTLPGD